MYKTNTKRKKKPNCCRRILKEIWSYARICIGISSIHGFNHLVSNKTIGERILWLVLILIALYGYITLTHETWHRYQVNPTVISIDVDHQHWNITFLTMTICPTIKEQNIDAYLQKNHKGKTKQEKSEFKKFLTALYTQESFKSFRNIFDFDKLRKEDYLNTLLELTSDFKPDISSTFQKFAVLRQVITELGICYSYNSEISIYNSPGYWKDKRWAIVDTSNEILRVTSTMGALSTTISDFDQASYIFFHSYNDVIDSATPRKYSKAMGIAQVQLNVMNLYTTEDVKPLKPTQRNCRLLHESNLAHSPVYSYTLCRIECRIQLCLQYCKCLPYFYRHNAGEAICDPAGMRCLSNYSEILETLFDKKNNTKLCNCAPNCDEDRSFLESYETGDWLFGSSVQWTLNKFPKIRYKRDLVFGLTDVLIYVGGMAGLFLGCGVLSFVEIFYFLTLKLYWHIYKYPTSQRQTSAIKLKEEKLRGTKSITF